MTLAVARRSRLKLDARLATSPSILSRLTMSSGHPGGPCSPGVDDGPAAPASTVRPRVKATKASAVAIRLGPQTALAR